MHDFKADCGHAEMARSLSDHAIKAREAHHHQQHPHGPAEGPAWSNAGAQGGSLERRASEWGTDDDDDDDAKEVTTVYIGNLPPEVDEVILCVPFASFGRIHSVQVSPPFVSVAVSFVRHAVELLCVCACTREMT